MNFLKWVTFMRSIISEYLPLKNSEKDRLWEKGIFVFDANILLNLYRFSKDTTDALLKALEKLSSRIWIPYQVASEFMRRRCDVIYDTIEKYSDFEKKIKTFIEDAKALASLSDSTKEIVELADVLKKWLVSCKKKNLLISNVNDDFILDKLLDLFNNRTGKRYASEKESALFIEGERRYKAQTPPGYKDVNKKISDTCDNNIYGDFILWNQIIDYSIDRKVDIIFITNDRKEDWWYEVKGRTIGPRTELLCEFRTRTKQQFHMYTMDSFLKMFNEKNGPSIKYEVIAEVKKTLDKINEQYQNQITNTRYDMVLEEAQKIKNELNYLDRKNIIDRQMLKYLMQSANNPVVEQLTEYDSNNDKIKTQILLNNKIKELNSEEQTIEALKRQLISLDGYNRE